jgi:hypothetical protein
VNVKLLVQMVNDSKLLIILALTIGDGARFSKSRDLLRSRDHRVYHLQHFFGWLGSIFPMTGSNQSQSPGGATWVAVAQRPSAEPSRPIQVLNWLISILLLIGVIIFVGRNYNFSSFVGDARKISLPVLTLVFLSLLGNALVASLRFKFVAMRIGHR